MEIYWSIWREVRSLPKTMKKIFLTKNESAIVDDEDFEKVNQYKWYCQVIGNNKYAYRTERIKGTKKKATILMHRLILGVIKDMEVDHIDMNGLNNSRSNLRICTHTENNRNKRLNKNNTSGYKGVYFDKYKKRWQAQIMVNRKMIPLGGFEDIKEAARKYNQAAIEYFGRFARLNK